MMDMRYLIPGDAVFPEGITTDGRAFYVSSSADGTIYRGEIGVPDLKVWLEAGTDGRDRALGMTVDPYGRLLVCGDGALYAYDLATSAFIAKRPVATEPTLLNDVYVLDGHAYVTDSLRPVLWRFRVDAEGVGEAEEFADISSLDPGELPYLNGVVPTASGDGLLAAAQGTGELWRFELATGAASRVDLGGVPVNGDGMVWVGDVLYVCDNTDEPDGSVRYWLTALRFEEPGRAALAGRWEQSEADTPTTAAYLGGRLLLVHSQFGARRSGRAAPPFTVGEVEVPL